MNKKSQTILLIISFCCLLITNTLSSTNPDDNHHNNNNNNDDDQYYTVKQAQLCFEQQVLTKCQDQIQNCFDVLSCQKEIRKYADCSFEGEQAQIFNGYCFKNWKETAVQSKSMINCFDNTCNLAGYNSDVSLGILYTCSQEALFKYDTECQQKCQLQLQNIISNKLVNTPIRQIYQSQEIKQAKEQTTKRVIEIVRKQCVQKTGSIRVKFQNQAEQERRRKMLLFQQQNNKRKQQRKNKKSAEQWQQL